MNIADLIKSADDDDGASEHGMAASNVCMPNDCLCVCASKCEVLFSKTRRKFARAKASVEHTCVTRVVCSIDRFIRVVTTKHRSTCGDIFAIRRNSCDRCRRRSDRANMYLASERVF